MMLRLRRYRIFVVGAVVILLLLYRVAQNSQWETREASISDSYTRLEAQEPKHNDARPPQSPVEQPLDEARAPDQAAPAPAPVKPQTIKLPELKTSLEVKGEYAFPTPAETHVPGFEQYAAPEPPLQTEKPVPPVDIPYRPPGKVEDIYAPDTDDKGLPIMQRPGGREGTSLSATSTIHWSKMPENFPVPEESLILLPTGKPKPIPKIQYDFSGETEVMKSKREERLDAVKSEFLRAWAGYKKYAWGHDELSPVTKSFRDPFCGWAATMVDALDTLWIMDLKEEFDESYEYVKGIDFTTTPYRSEIPVFETTIRYLGGLISAFDISGGHAGNYYGFLDKAVELGEILIGIFDTPNRMPVLYYNWKPAYASQPQRAGTSVSIAELGSLSMEFTRLAQLTGKNKYYDAIARITDALVEYQNREFGQGAAALPGIFPELIDASGCNRTVPRLHSLRNSSPEAKAQAQVKEAAPEPHGYSPHESEAERLSFAKQKEVATKGTKDLEFEVKPGSYRGAPATGEIHHISKRAPLDTVEKPVQPAADAQPEAPGAKKSGPYSSNGRKAEWDCRPQALTASTAAESFSMGGSQDSTYEYFPKEYILLGGLEPKYRSLHEKAVEAIKKYLLYRPMIKEDRDILFSSKAVSRDGTDQHLRQTYEVTHLTCFLGGMFGLGGKIFDRPGDVEIAKQLTDGCVWAYDSMPHGIMPEIATVVPCPDAHDCPWNDTQWRVELDPQWAQRDIQVENFLKKHAEWEAHMEEAKKEEAMRLAAEEAEEKRLQMIDTYNDREMVATDTTESSGFGDAEDVGMRNTLADTGASGFRMVDTHAKTAGDDTKTSTAGSQGATSGAGTLDEEGTRFRMVDTHNDIPEQSGSGGSSPANMGSPGEDGPSSEGEAPRRVKRDEPAAEEVKGYLETAKKQKKLDEEMDLNRPSGRTQGYGGDPGQAPPPQKKPKSVLPPEPQPPLSHDQYVDRRIKDEYLPPGFVALNDRRYILRPEAIESVWYMYRITGDPVWQERGWRMFTAIVKHTRTNDGASAIDDVAFPIRPRPTDKMESFWPAETLKYFYLLYTTPDVVSLDEWVLNTEAHPFRRPG